MVESVAKYPKETTKSTCEEFASDKIIVAR